MDSRISAVSILAFMLASAGAAFAQTASPATASRPDLQGFWTNVSVTSLQRPGNLKSLVLTEEEAQQGGQPQHPDDPVEG